MARRGNCLAIEVNEGMAILASPTQLQVATGAGEKQTIEAKRFILAPGSVAATMPVPDIDESIKRLESNLRLSPEEARKLVNEVEVALREVRG